MKNKKLTNSEEIAKLYTDTYRTRMPLYNDYVFHRIYGSDTEESKAALVGLLNIILERKDDPIRRLEIKNPIDIGDWILDKDTTMDIKAETDSGELLTIEMQVSHLTDYRCRILFYGGRLVNSSLKSGEPYGNTRVCHLEMQNGVLCGLRFCCKYALCLVFTAFDFFENIYLHNIPT